MEITAPILPMTHHESLIFPKLKQTVNTFADYAVFLSAGIFLGSLTC